MKNNTVVFLMLLILMALIGRLIYLNHNGNVNLSSRVEFEDVNELAIFVTLENEVRRNQQGVLSGSDTTYSSVTASIILNENTEEKDIEVSKEPSYVSLYPSLYTSPIGEQKSPGDGKKVCYLTFDDGPSELTWEILDILDEKNVKATFFVIGVSMSEKELECLKEIVSRGHTIGLHTYHHNYDRLYKSVDNFLADYEKVYNLVVETTGVRPNIYRFPGGSYNMYIKKNRKAIIAEMERRGFTHYDWNVSGEDAIGNPTTSTIMKNINKDIYRFQCPVVLLHDSKINSKTVAILPKLIDNIRENGYEFDTVDKREPCQFSW